MVATFSANVFVTEAFQSPENLGAIEVSTFVGMILFGLSLAQGYTFFRRSGEDGYPLRLFIFLLLSLETLHSFMAAHTIYFDTVTNWRMAEPNSYPLSITVLAETLITLMVQCFFCHRIHKLSGRLSISLACFILSAGRFIGGLALSVESFMDVPRTPRNGIFVFTFSWLITLSLAVGAAADLLIAASLSYYLRKLASPMNLKSTTAVINRLVRWSLQTGIVTSQTSIAVIICFQAMSNMVWFGLYIILAKLYSVSLLVSLNARPHGSENCARDEEVGQSDLQFEAFRSPISINFQVARTTYSDALEWSPPVPPKN